GVDRARSPMARLLPIARPDAALRLSEDRPADPAVAGAARALGAEVAPAPRAARSLARHVPGRDDRRNAPRSGVGRAVRCDDARVRRADQLQHAQSGAGSGGGRADLAGGGPADDRRHARPDRGLSARSSARQRGSGRLRPAPRLRRRARRRARAVRVLFRALSCKDGGHMNIQEQVDRLIDTRPGKELLSFTHDERAYRINDFIHRSGGTSASYLLVSSAGRVIVNTVMGWEPPHHNALFDGICSEPTPYVITTQGHVDHVGGVALFREPGTRYVAQAMNQACQADDARIARFRAGTALLWFGQLGGMIGEFARKYPGAALGQDRPVPDITFESRLAPRVGAPRRAHSPAARR